MKSLFFKFVNENFNNDPSEMLEYFDGNIYDIAKEMGIDWGRTKNYFKLDSGFVSNEKVAFIGKKNKGKVGVIGWVNQYRTRQGEVIYYPYLRFNNFRGSYDEPICFNGLDYLFTAFDEGMAKTNRRVSFPLKLNNLHNVKLDQIENKQKSLNIDFELYTKLSYASIDSNPYLKKKGMNFILNNLKIKQGQDIYGCYLMIEILDIETQQITGFQRIYKNKKIFSKGSIISGKCWTSSFPSNGDSLIVTESFLDAALAFCLTKIISVAALCADNMSAVAKHLRKQCPESHILFVADNDQYTTDGYNKGVISCLDAANSINGNCWICVPTFSPREKELKFKDLSDFYKAYGEAATIKLLENKS